MTSLRNYGRSLVQKVKRFNVASEGSVTIETVLVIAVSVMLLIGILKICGVSISGGVEQDGLFTTVKNWIFKHLGFGG